MERASCRSLHPAFCMRLTAASSPPRPRLFFFFTTVVRPDLWGVFFCVTTLGFSLLLCWFAFAWGWPHCFFTHGLFFRGIASRFPLSRSR
jgi:hypothetical protein